MGSSSYGGEQGQERNPVSTPFYLTPLRGFCKPLEEELPFPLVAFEVLLPTDGGLTTAS